MPDQFILITNRDFYNSSGNDYVTVPMFEIVSNPTIRISDIKRRPLIRDNNFNPKDVFNIEDEGIWKSIK